MSQRIERYFLRVAPDRSDDGADILAVLAAWIHTVPGIAVLAREQRLVRRPALGFLFQHRRERRRDRDRVRRSLARCALGGAALAGLRHFQDRRDRIIDEMFHQEPRGLPWPSAG